MELVLPKLQNLLSKDAKASDEDIRKYVHVLNGHAVVSNKIIVAVDLREYIKRECDISDEDDLERLTHLVAWMEGKSFPFDYWKELTKKSFVSLLDKGLEIENNDYSKILIYNDAACVLNNIIDMLTSNLNKEEVNVGKIAIPSDLILKLSSVFSSETKSLDFIFQFTGEDSIVKFQAYRKEYIFGIMPTNYDPINDIYNFQTMKLFYDELMKSILE